MLVQMLVLVLVLLLVPKQHRMQLGLLHVVVMYLMLLLAYLLLLVPKSYHFPMDLCQVVRRSNPNSDTEATALLHVLLVVQEASMKAESSDHPATCLPSHQKDC